MKIKSKKYWRKTSLKNKKDGDFLLNSEIIPKLFSLIILTILTIKQIIKK